MSPGNTKQMPMQQNANDTAHWASRKDRGVLPVEGVEGWLNLPVAQAQLAAQTLNDPSATCTR